MRFLVAVDKPLGSIASLDFGAVLASKTGVGITLLAVGRYETDRPRLIASLDRAYDRIASSVKDVRRKVLIGQPMALILQEVASDEYSLMILGSIDDKKKLDRILVAPHITRVIERSPCPVVIVRGDTRTEPGLRDDLFERILICDSNIDAPSLLQRFASKFGKLLATGADITILHVMSQMSAGPGVMGKQLRADAEELIQEHVPEGVLLERDIEILKQLNVPATPKVRHGLVVEEIQKEAKSGDYDLVIIGAHRGEGWQRILLDDLAQQIIAHVDRPVMIVR
ncbi:MAG: universal stress protein [Anaerolineales bacterium]|nr:universal stress protein [Anaerolineales bacterium]